MRRALGRIALLTMTVGMLATSAHAGTDAAGAQPAAAPAPAPITPGAEAHQAALELSPYELASLLRERLFAYTVTPRATTSESSVRSAWRVALKSRAGRMLARMDRVSDSKRWNVRGASSDTWAPTTESTARILRDLSGLYVELAASQKQMAKARVVEQQVLQFGHIRPRTERKPTREAEIHGQRFGSHLGIHGTLGGGGGVGINVGLRHQVRRVRIKIYDREIEERMQAARQAKIDRQVAAIRARIDAYTDSLGKDLELVRTLAASLQLAEEMRLADETTKIEDAGARRQALVLLDQMKVGRVEARGRSFRSAARYGTALRRSWTQKRAKLEKLLAEHVQNA